MKTLLLSSLLALGLLFAQSGATKSTLDIAGPTLPAYMPGAQSSVYLKIEGGRSCTGTIIGRRAVLTATHCIDDSHELTHVNDVRMDARVTANDGNDHVILRTSKDVEGRIAKVVPLPPVGTEVYIWGNTLSQRALLRRGTFIGRVEDKEWLVFDMNMWFGDSGSGVFDSHGNVVAVLYGGTGENSRIGSIKLMLAYEMKLTDYQLEQARK